MGCDDFFKKAKKARMEKDYERKISEERREKPRILIICEGKRTEPNYFACFHGANIVVKGFGMNTDSLVRKAIEIRDKDEYGFNQVWCVFDRDDFPAERFNNAFIIARQEDISIAYSNEAFELWYLLHFYYYDAAIKRNQYFEKLSDEMIKLFGIKYEKNNLIMYDILKSRQNLAIKHAKKLLSQYNPLNPEKDKPSTTVFTLVEELNKWIS